LEAPFLILRRSVKRLRRSPTIDPRDSGVRSETAPVAGSREDHASSLATPRSCNGRNEAAERQCGTPLLDKLAQLARFGLGAEDPPLLEPARKRL
jgi:hypothetical protein